VLLEQVNEVADELEDQETKDYAVSDDP